MNILFLADIVPYPPNTGIKIRTYNLSKELARAGNKIYLICFNHPIFIPDSLTKQRYTDALLEFCKEVHILDIPGEGTKIASYWKLFRNLFERQPYRVKRYYSRQCRNLILDILQRVDIDIVHLDKTEFFNYTEFTPDIISVPTNHNVESLLFMRRAHRETTWLRKLFAILQHRKTARYEKYALQQVPAYIACTDNDYCYFSEYLGINTPCCVINNGVDTEYYQPLGESSGNYILLIGAQSKEATANYDSTLHFVNDIWPLIRRQNSDLQLHIVGRNPDPVVQSFAEADPNISVLGFVSDERELGLARALVVPLRIGGGSRLKILTALAMGVPIVSTSIGAEGIDYHDGEDLLISNVPDEFARLVLELVCNSDLRCRLSNNGRKLVESRYNWRFIGSQLNKFYNGLIDKSFQSSR